MPRHPYFDLELLDDATLTMHIDAPIATRHTIHEWPLSCVQRITCHNGAQYIYKSQTSPSVEGQLYRTCTAPHLLKATVIDDNHLILPYIASQPIPRERAIVSHVMAAIASMPPSTPVYQRVETVEAWDTLMQTTVDALTHLVNTGRFTHLTSAHITLINDYAHHPHIEALWHGPIGVVHGDLGLHNLLYHATHIYIIDWQRPCYGPRVIDEWMLSSALNLTHTLPPMAEYLCILREIAWLTEAAIHWFPTGHTHYDTQITACARRLSI